MMIISVRQVLSAVGMALALAAGALAQPAAPSAPLPPSFALLSLVGDQFSVIFRRQESGTRLDPNSRRDYPVPTGIFDEMAVSAAEDVVKRLKPVSPVLRFSIRDARLFALQEQLLVDADDSRGVREALAKLLRENAVTRLLLVTKRRDDAKFDVVSGTIGSGKIAGIGFYVDTFTSLQTTQTGEATVGFLGPYAYLNVALVDVASMKVIRSIPAREADMTLPLHATGAMRAWDALTAEGKADALERVLRRAVQNATTAALAD
jgi:hypothetical protein